QVVALGSDGLTEITIPPRIIRHDAVLRGHRSLVIDAATVVGGGVAGDGAVAERQRPVVVDAASEGSGVAGDGAVAERQRSRVVDAADVVGGGVAGDGAV